MLIYCFFVLSTSMSSALSLWLCLFFPFSVSMFFFFLCCFKSKDHNVNVRTSLIISVHCFFLSFHRPSDVDSFIARKERCFAQREVRLAIVSMPMLIGD